MSFGTVYADYPRHDGRESVMMPSPGGGTPVITSIGDVPSVFGTFTMPTPNSTDGVLGDYKAAAFANSKAGFSGDLNYLKGLNIATYISMRLMQTNFCRMFIGFTDNTAINMVASDSPTGNYFGLFYSSSLDPSNFYIISNDGTGMVDAVFSSVDTNSHKLFLRLFPAVLATLDGCNLQMDDNIHNDFHSTIPSDTTPLRFAAAIETLNANTKSLRIGKVSIKQGG